MILSGTGVGFFCVGALFLAALLLAYLDKQAGKLRPADEGKQRVSSYSRGALILFLSAFLGGVVVTLMSGTRPRDDSQSMGMIKGRAGSPLDSSEGSGLSGPERNASMGASIGKVDPKELQTLEEKIKKDPKDVKSRERLGHLHLQRQDFENVFKMAHETLQIDPQSAESRVHMGMVFFAMQELDQAIDQFDQALKIDPKNLEGLLFKGIVLFQGKQDLKGARASWQRFMEIAKPTDTGYERVRMFLKMIENQSPPKDGD